MNKNFDEWNICKKRINDSRYKRFYKERDIWWCSLGANIGSEQDGKNDQYQRPVLIVRGLSSEICIIVPITSSLKHHPYRVSIGLIQGVDAKVIVSQLKVIDVKRLTDKICMVNSHTFDVIKKSIRDLF